MASIAPLVEQYPGRLVAIASEHGGRLAEIFAGLFPDYFLSRFGRRFLAENFWWQFSTRKECFGFVWIEERQVCGYAAGTLQRKQFLSNVVRRSPLRFVWSAAVASVRQPIVLWEGAELLARLSQEAHDDGPEAELLAFGVLPRSWIAAGNESPAKILMDAAIAEFSARGSRQFRLYTSAANHLACRFYRTLGFVEQKRFRLFGKEKICFVASAATAAR